MLLGSFKYILNVRLNSSTIHLTLVFKKNVLTDWSWPDWKEMMDVPTTR